MRIRSGDVNYFTQWYLWTLTKGLTKLEIGKDEVCGLKWFEKSELRDDVSYNPRSFIHKMEKWVEIFT